MTSIKVEKDYNFIDKLITAADQGEHLSPWQLFEMAYQAEKMRISPEFSGLRALEYLPHMDFLEHQVSTAEQVIEGMNGRAILADEVGLGKTIEAGLILKEYMVRGMVKKALLLVPASLVNQWVKELNEKFYIPAIAYRKNYAWDQYDIIVSSLDTAKRPPNREAIQDIDYDFLLVDEAHKLKNHKTRNYDFVRGLKKKYCLLLSATPVQNKLIEIFNLVSILKPGLLGNYDSFLEQFGKDRKNLKDNYYLKQLIKKVMIRNTRKETSMDQTSRHIETVWMDFSPEERKVYEDIYSSTKSLSSFSNITYLRELCSSREACFLSLQKMAADEEKTDMLKPLLDDIGTLPHHVKAGKVVELIQTFQDEKVIIFTEYRATQLYLQWYLQQHGISSVPFRGGFKRGKKDWMRQLFRDHAQVLIATEAGGEGINLQFCNRMINYDLPWNPMRLEQRIGRIHRYGQEKDVHIYNFAIRGTIEEHIMSLLYEKIHMFEQVIGHLDDILAELKIDDLESEIQSIYKESSTIGETKIKLDNLGEIIRQTQMEKDKEEQHYGN
ncbi:DEAD/DEAH box helicase [Virgibacillus sediminis]|uniref:DEAD/DEAH box helicase n=1 Tax=Virgibacillus sediminis TaxID=202260 RepID=A0ABV7A5Q7_9BACI